MAYILQTSPTRTTTGATPLISIGETHAWSADYATSQNEPGEGRIFHLGADLDEPFGFTFRNAIVKNMYTNTDIPLSQRDNVTKGVRTMCTHVATWSLENEDDKNDKTLYRPACTISMTLPYVGCYSEEDVKQLLTDTFSGLFDEQGNLRVMTMVRGKLLPTVNN